MRTNEDQAAVASDSVDAEEWLAEFDCAFARIAGRFGRVEPRRRARAFLLGLLSDVDSRSCWQLAEQAGDASPHGMQRLLGEAVWDADKVRDDVRGYAVEELGDPAAVLVLDDTGDLKKGVHTIGVQRQYTGTAGRIENSQVAVFLAYAAPRGYTLIDREIYLPRCWTDAPARCAAAGVPEHVRFATKITLARRMLARALDAGTPAAWCTADEFYGGDRALRRDLQGRGVGYVLAVARSHRVTACPAIGAQRGGPGRRCPVVSGVEPLQRRRWRQGAARVRVGMDGHHPARRRGHRTSLAAGAPQSVRRRAGVLPLLVTSPGRAAHPGQGGRHPLVHRNLLPDRQRRGRLDEHQVRRWDSWYRYTTLVMLAHAVLTVIAAHERRRLSAGQELIPLTINEIRRLLAKLITNTVHTIDHRLAWSRWRRRHQARAKTSHYRRRGQIEYRLAST